MPVSINKGQALQAPGMTSLIDVVFLLLIFFLVATRLSEDDRLDRQIEVELPTISMARPLSIEPKELYVDINRQGNFFVRGQRVSAAELERILREAAAANPDRQSVVVRGDKLSPLQATITVMGLCNQAGIHRYRPSVLEPE